MTKLDHITANDIENGYQLAWSELADMTHADQVRLFNWCACEDGEAPYTDCTTTRED